MLDVQNWSPWVIVCLAGCGVGVLVVAGFFFRLGVNIITDVIGGISGTQRARLPAPPPRPSFSPAPRAQAAPPPPISFDEALARRQSMMNAPSAGFPATPPVVGQGGTMNAQSVPTPASVPPLPGLPPRPTFQPMPPSAGFPSVQPPSVPHVQPGSFSPAQLGSGLARPSLSQGVPYRPAAGLPVVGSFSSFGTPNNPFDERRHQRRLQDDRYEIYTDEDDVGGGLDMLF